MKNTLNFKGLVKTFIRQKKEIYYPLITIILGYSIYFIISFLYEHIKSKEILIFLLLSLIFLTVQILKDCLRLLKKGTRDQTKYFMLLVKICVLFLVILIFNLALLVIIGLGSLLIESYFNLISISINLFVITTVFYFLRAEVLRYYSNKDLKVKENNSINS